MLSYLEICSTMIITLYGRICRKHSNAAPQYHEGIIDQDTILKDTQPWYATVVFSERAREGIEAVVSIKLMRMMILCSQYWRTGYLRISLLSLS